MKLEFIAARLYRLAASYYLSRDFVLHLFLFVVFTYIITSVQKAPSLFDDTQYFKSDFFKSTSAVQLHLSDKYLP